MIGIDVEMKDESNVSSSISISINSIYFIRQFKFIHFFAIQYFYTFFNPFLFKYRQKH